MVSLEELLLGKPIFHIRQKGVPPLLLPTSMLQLPRCLVRICNLDSHDTTLFELDNFKTCNCSWKTWFQNHICFANVGCSPTPRQHFWKIAGAKNFLFACGSIFGNDASKENGLSRPAKGGSTPAFAYQRAAITPLPCLNLQPWFSWYNFVWIGQFQKCNCSRKTKLQNPICFATVGCSPTPRQHFWKTAAPKNFLFACGSYFTTNYVSSGFWFACIIIAKTSCICSSGNRFGSNFTPIYGFCIPLKTIFPR